MEEGTQKWKSALKVILQPNSKPVCESICCY